MSYCFNPNCSKPRNPDDAKFCLTCGTKLLLKDRYRAIQPLGLGGCSRTFKAIDQDRLQHPCVIKLFLLSPEQDHKATELFNQEALRLYELGKNEQIPELYAHFEQDNQLYLVQEFIDGKTLLDELQDQETQVVKPYKESKLRKLLADLLPVLNFIHEQGVIHRDLKPANIIRRCSDDKFVLIDFGGAKQATGRVLADQGTMIGTLGYAPAEQLQSGTVHPASDLYALGATCIHLLTGVHPFDLYNSLEGSLNWRGSLPEETKISPQLGEILDKLVKNMVKDRYQSATQVLQALNLSDIATKITAPQINPQLAVIDYLQQSLLDESPTSEREIDYTKLQDLLSAKKWQEADEETRQKMLEIMGKQQRGYLDNEDMQKFPCKDLFTINQLWLNYTNGCFGFSVQKQIWIEEGGKLGIYDLMAYEKFAVRVGWRENDTWKSYSELTFVSEKPPGHLPLSLSLGWGTGAIKLVGVEGAVEADCFFSRVDNCKL
ncbi:GUN4 domain-containing protein [Lyngbya aestuarii]|uniref:GUN4 domain-containing protein n=1 Tax=Lyngbya aestuarii TaxID=118322 RepID=UPI00403DAEAC